MKKEYEHRSKDQENNVANKCVFCIADQDWGDTKYYKEFFPGFPKRTIFETNNFVVFPAIGQIVEGYLLIVTKQHFLSTAHVPEELIEELERVMVFVRRLLTDVYQPPIFYEHGPMSSTHKGGCSIMHAHIHAVPVKIELTKRLEKQFSGQKISRLEDLRDQKLRNQSYIFLENTDGVRFVYDVPILPSQYVRRIIAKCIGVRDSWDWKKSLTAERIETEREFMKRTINIKRYHLQGSYRNIEGKTPLAPTSRQLRWHGAIALT